MKQLLFAVFLFAGSVSLAQSTITIGSTLVDVDTVLTGLDIPWEIIYGPDDHIWTTERRGIVSRINPTNETKTEILDLTGSVYQNAESGLLGMALHPDFGTTPEVFLAYTYESGGNIRERFVKYTYDGTNLVNPQVLLEDIIGNTTHIGARFAFLPDGTLLVSTGDAQNTTLPQNVNSLSGKILRMNTDGSIPTDNPTPGSYVYTWGHRNVQGILRAPNGIIYLSEHGASSDDEFQILEAGRNYGWPNVEGFCDVGTAEENFCNTNNVKEPLTVWTPTIAPSDMVFYQNATFPEFHNKVLMTVLKDRKLVALELNGAGTDVVDEVHYLTNVFGRLRDICVGPDQAIYLATNGQSWSNTNPNTHSIVRLKVADNAAVLQANAEQIRVFPNPANDELTIQIPSTYKLGVLEISDLQGRVIKTVDVLEESTSVLLEGIPSGLYFLRIHKDGLQELTTSLVKN